MNKKMNEQNVCPETPLSQAEIERRIDLANDLYLKAASKAQGGGWDILPNGKIVNHTTRQELKVPRRSNWVNFPNLNLYGNGTRIGRP
jgi:hypothetical protein